MPYQFKPGQSGNPKGRPPGSVSLRDQIRQHLEDNPEVVKELIQYFVKKNPELMWQMLEGSPPKYVAIANPDGSNIGEPSHVVQELANKLNEIHGSTSVGSDGGVAGALGAQALDQDVERPTV